MKPCLDLLLLTDDELKAARKKYVRGELRDKQIAEREEAEHHHH